MVVVLVVVLVVVVVVFVYRLFCEGRGLEIEGHGITNCHKFEHDGCWPQGHFGRGKETHDWHTYLPLWSAIRPSLIFFLHSLKRFRECHTFQIHNQPYLDILSSLPAPYETLPRLAWARRPSVLSLTKCRVVFKCYRWKILGSCQIMVKFGQTELALTMEPCNFLLLRFGGRHDSLNEPSWSLI